MVERRSMMMCGGRSWWMRAMSLRLMIACSSMSETMLGLGVGLGASATTMSKEIFRLAELFVSRGSTAVCRKKAVRGKGMVCHLLPSVWYVMDMSL